MKKYLARHTEYDNPDNIFPFRLPVHLLHAGREHAARMGTWFKDNTAEHINIVSSPVARCIQTAEIISSKTGSYVTLTGKVLPDYLWTPELEPHNIARGEIAEITIQEGAKIDFKRIKV